MNRKEGNVALRERFLGFCGEMGKYMELPEFDLESGLISLGEWFGKEESRKKELIEHPVVRDMSRGKFLKRFREADKSEEAFNMYNWTSEVRAFFNDRKTRPGLLVIKDENGERKRVEVVDGAINPFLAKPFNSKESDTIAIDAKLTCIFNEVMGGDNKGPSSLFCSFLGNDEINIPMVKRVQNLRGFCGSREGGFLVTCGMSRLSFIDFESNYVITKVVGAIMTNPLTNIKLLCRDIDSLGDTFYGWDSYLGRIYNIIIDRKNRVIATQYMKGGICEMLFVQPPTSFCCFNGKFVFTTPDGIIMGLDTKEVTPVKGSREVINTLFDSQGRMFILFKRSEDGLLVLRSEEEDMKCLLPNIKNVTYDTFTGAIVLYSNTHLFFC